jgi:hypothetical protein
MDEPFSEDSERMRLNDAHTNSSERSPSRSSVEGQLIGLEPDRPLTFSKKSSPVMAVK